MTRAERNDRGDHPLLLRRCDEQLTDAHERPRTARKGRAPLRSNCGSRWIDPQTALTRFVVIRADALTRSDLERLDDVVPAAGRLADADRADPVAVGVGGVVLKCGSEDVGLGHAGDARTGAALAGG